MGTLCENKDFVEIGKSVEGIESDDFRKLLMFRQYLLMRNIDIPPFFWRKRLAINFQRLVTANIPAFSPQKSFNDVLNREYATVECMEERMLRSFINLNVPLTSIICS